MDIFISRGERDPEIRIRFPAEPDSVWPMLAELDEHCASNDPVRIVGAFYPIPNLTQYISGADMEQEADIRKLNALAGLVDTMGAEERRIFSVSTGWMMCWVSPPAWIDMNSLRASPRIKIWAAGWWSTGKRRLIFPRRSGPTWTMLGSVRHTMPAMAGRTRLLAM